jgi:hypothetical protein
MPEMKAGRRKAIRWIIRAFIAAIVLAVALVSILVFAIGHKNSTSPPVTQASGNVQPQSAVLVNDNCDNPGRIEPVSIQLTCGDGTAYANHLSWRQWSRETAIGTGTINVVNCVPDCANGQDVAYRMRLELSEPVRAGSGAYYFTRVNVLYLDRGPSGAHMTVYKDCFDTPPAPFVPRCPPNCQGGTCY